jgi:hypothetical protein
MNEALHTQLAWIGDKVRAAAIPADSKESALWCVGQLPALYIRLDETCESRFGDEIARLVQVTLKLLLNVKKTTPALEQLAADIPDRLRNVHEKLGIPALTLKTPRAAPSRSGKRK